MTSVGVRELKQRTSEVLRRVREGREGIEVTVRGEVVAVLLPVAAKPPRRRSTTADPWTNVDRLAREIAVRWPRNVTAAAAVSRQRRA